jgi:hypothetical protein
MLYWSAESLTEAGGAFSAEDICRVRNTVDLSDAPGTPQSVKVQGVESALTHCMSHGKPAPLRIEGSSFQDRALSLRRLNKQPRSMTATTLAVLGFWSLRDYPLGFRARGRAVFRDGARYHGVRPRRAEALGFRWAGTHHAKRNRGNCYKGKASDGHFGSPCGALGGLSLISFSHGIACGPAGAIRKRARSTALLRLRLAWSPLPRLLRGLGPCRRLHKRDRVGHPSAWTISFS